MAIGRNITVGIDLGSHQVKVIVVEKDTKQDRDALPRIVATGVAESKGIRHGFVTNIADASKSIKSAVSQAERTLGTTIRKAYISIGGIGLGAIISTGSTAVTKADNDITGLDVKRAIEESEKELPNHYIQNRKIIYTVPLEYKIDGKKVLGRPHGLKAMRLEARVLYITSLAHHLSDLMSAFEEADIIIQDVAAAPIAASVVSLSKTQKIAGCVLANIGAETTSIIVFENNIPVSMEVFQIGSNDITNDLALGLKVSLEDAELIKIGQGRIGEFSKKKIEEIVIARLSDIFDLLEDHLRKIDRNGLLPAGIILTGGGSSIPNIEELSRLALRLPSKQGKLRLDGNVKGIVRDSEWAVAYGLAIIGLTEDEGETGAGDGILPGHIWDKTGKSLWAWLKRFLP